MEELHRTPQRWKSFTGPPQRWKSFTGLLRGGGAFSDRHQSVTQLSCQLSTVGDVFPSPGIKLPQMWARAPAPNYILMSGSVRRPERAHRVTAGQPPSPPRLRRPVGSVDVGSVCFCLFGSLVGASLDPPLSPSRRPRDLNPAPFGNLINDFLYFAVGQQLFPLWTRPDDVVHARRTEARPPVGMLTFHWTPYPTQRGRGLGGRTRNVQHSFVGVCLKRRFVSDLSGNQLVFCETLRSAHASGWKMEQEAF